MRILTVRQPWAWLIIYAHKDIENRDWVTQYRGPLGIHAGKGMTKNEYQDALDFVATFDHALASRIPEPKDLVRGAIIGTVMLIDCVTKSPSPWFQGKYGFEMVHPKPFVPPIPAKGALGLWSWEQPG